MVNTALTAGQSHERGFAAVSRPIIAWTSVVIKAPNGPYRYAERSIHPYVFEYPSGVAFPPVKMVSMRSRIEARTPAVTPKTIEVRISRVLIRSLVMFLIEIQTTR
jgi:hypothetical protein